MPLKYAEIMKGVDGVTEVTPVLNWHVSNIKGESRAVNLWAIDYPSFARISGGFDVLQGRALEKPYDLVMDTVLADATGIHAGDKLPMINRDFTVVGIIRAGAGGRLYARLTDVQEAIGTPDRASFFLVKGRSSLEADKLAQALQARFPGHKITPVAQVSKVMQENATGLKQFKQALTAMAVVISFLVVLLAMYTTIIERTREIGILRCIGARARDVRRIFASESGVLAVAGWMLGIPVGYALDHALVRLVKEVVNIDLPVLFPAANVVLALVGTVALALLVTLLPIRRAVRLRPGDALRYG
jgi:putative ABC transport system permease protein